MLGAQDKRSASRRALTVCDLPLLKLLHESPDLTGDLRLRRERGDDFEHERYDTENPER
jgi:hypothetical protein